MPCPEIDELEPFLSGELEGGAASSIEEHLSGCAECRSRVAELRENLALVEPLRPLLTRPLATRAVPTQIGGYRIIREIGRGGMGIVYEAEQDNPRRLVALKILNVAYAWDDRYERLFRREVQALARLRHPCIATIYGAGRLPETGGAFLTMERVEGMRLSEHVRTRNPSQRQRLELFTSICEAMAFAHQRGVIHRDIKPSNILVEADGRPKVMDFGLAKLLSPDDSIAEATVSLGPGRVEGTLPYMSPEQACGDSPNIGVLSDVYSLGLLLYELLTGRLPYPIDPANWPEAVRIIGQQNPLRPSSLNAALRGDLETIILKALQKEPDRRYSSAAALCDDIRRFLHDEPILARPSSLVYQMRKLVRRHRLPFAIGALGMALVMAFGIAATVLAWRLAERRAEAVRAWGEEQRARHVAVQAKDEALAQAAIAAGVNEFLNEMLGAANPERGGHARDLKIIELLNWAAAHVGDRFRDQPAVEAGIRFTLGNTYRALAEYASAEEQLRRSLEIRRALYPQGHPDLAQTMNKLGRCLMDHGQFAEAETLFRECLAMRRRLLGNDHPDVTIILNNLAELFRVRGLLDEAEAINREVLVSRIRLFGEETSEVATSLNNLALVLYGKKDWAGAEPLLRRSLEIDLKLRGPDHPNVAATMHNLAAVLGNCGRQEEAETLQRQSLATFQKLLGDDHPRVGHARYNLGMRLLEDEKFEEAEQHLNASVEIFRSRFGAEHRDTAKSLAGLSKLMLTRGKYEEAEQRYRDVCRLYLTTLGPDHADTLGALHHLAVALMSQGKNEEARSILEEALASQRRLLGESHPDTRKTVETLATLHGP